MKLKEMKSVIDQAYFIITGIEGSWLFDATWPQNQDEAWCKNFVGQYTECCGWDNAGVQEMIDDGWEYHQSIDRSDKHWDIMKQFQDEPATTIDTVYGQYIDVWKVCEVLREVGDSETKYYTIPA